jgi:hypothetical protein
VVIFGQKLVAYELRHDQSRELAAHRGDPVSIRLATSPVLARL